MSDIFIIEKLETDLRNTDGSIETMRSYSIKVVNMYGEIIVNEIFINQLIEELQKIN